jgi:hypothetical protein
MTMSPSLQPGSYASAAQKVLQRVECLPCSSKDDESDAPIDAGGKVREVGQIFVSGRVGFTAAIYDLNGLLDKEHDDPG